MLSLRCESVVYFFLSEKASFGRQPFNILSIRMFFSSKFWNIDWTLFFFPFPFILLSSILLRSKIMYVSWGTFFQGTHHVSLWERLGIRFPQIKNQISTNQNSELDIDVTCVVGCRPGESRGSHLPLFCSILRPDRPTPPAARSWHTAWSLA